MRFLSTLVLIALLFPLTGFDGAKAYEFSSSDMFYDQHWVYDRPRVRSDWSRSSEMLPTPPVMFHSNADLFDRLRPPYTYGREDMFPAYGVGLQRPYHVLTIDPIQGPYDAR